MLPTNRQDSTQILNHYLLPFTSVPSLFSTQGQLVQTMLAYSAISSFLLVLSLPITPFFPYLFSLFYSFSKAFPKNISWPDLWDSYTCAPKTWDCFWLSDCIPLRLLFILLLIRTTSSPYLVPIVPPFYLHFSLLYFVYQPNTNHSSYSNFLPSTHTQSK